MHHSHPPMRSGYIPCHIWRIKSANAMPSALTGSTTSTSTYAFTAIGRSLREGTEKWVCEHVGVHMCAHFHLSA